jgi:F-BAR domain only protein
MFVPNPVPPVDARNSFNVEAIPAISTGAAAAVAGAADLVLPIKRAEAPGTVPEDRAVSDSTSVHSGHSLAGLVQHPELHEPGLNASIVETVSTSFSDGKVTRSFVVGEIALAYNQTSELSADAETETIRLENFQDLEKAAANPAFVTAAVSDKGKERASVEDRTGEYSVAVSAIRKPVPTVALKYQLHLDEANLSAYSPVFFTPAWQIQDSQASVIVVYEVNPTFAHTSTTLTLKNVVITVALDTSADAGKAANAMMAPTAGASFKRKQSLVVWRFPELIVDTEQKKLLARFITTGAPPKPGPTETKWELPNMIGSGLSVSTLAAEASDPFADESASAGQTRSWNRIGCAKKLVSGRYSAS